MERLNRLLAVAYLVFALLGSGAVLHAILTFPSELPRLSAAANTAERQAAIEAAEALDWIEGNLTATARPLVAGPLFWVADRTRAVTAPSTWQRDNSTLEQRVDRLNAAITEMGREFDDVAVLMAVVFGGGSLLGLAMLRWPGFVTYLGALAVSLGPAPVVSAPLIGLNDPELFYWSMPMAVTAGGLVLLRLFVPPQPPGSTLASAGWFAIKAGLAVVVVGSAVTIGGVLWVMEMGGGTVLVTAAGPVLYGLYLIYKGVSALMRSRG
ncbi:hypothetical protein [Tropicimonas sp. IMCC6043]|uniref:hypothetical protein n=1 Tax=Tropicimonas sp. IMCC6043 TaxID=2510645 RepID=UPI00101BC945|nr:hypothetical protein [Tropicimonas sp. IMCC6043]RYH07611.1 hypothetical protein EU800_19615 [Tropicimonas sp. IMCC6043]